MARQSPLRGRTFATIAEEHYEAEMASRRAADEHAAHLRAMHERSLTDPALQCAHGVSLYGDTFCPPCGAEVGESW